MGKLAYLTLCSLDGYVEDSHGGFDWAEPSEEVHGFVNDLARPVGTHLYGRRMYETMAVWETDPRLAAAGGVYGDFAAIWQAADKVVYSTTLAGDVPTRRTRVERRFDPPDVRAMKASAAADLMIGGATLAADAFRFGLIDECHLVLMPVSLGGGKPALPHGTLINLALLDHRRFADGTVYLRYQTKPTDG